MENKTEIIGNVDNWMLYKQVTTTDEGNTYTKYHIGYRRNYGQGNSHEDRLSFRDPKDAVALSDLIKETFVESD